MSTTDGEPRRYKEGLAKIPVIIRFEIVVTVHHLNFTHHVRRTTPTSERKPLAIPFNAAEMEA
jgi:hypothetical protein